MSVCSIIEALDNDEDIINQQFDGFLVWPTVRFVIIQHFIDKENQLNSPKSTNSSTGLIQGFIGLLKAMLYCPVFGPNKPIVIFSTGTANIKTENGIYFNRVCDYFYETHPHDTWMIENPVGFTHLTPKKNKIYSKLPYNILLEIKAKLTLKFNKKKAISAEREISKLINRINSLGLEFNDEYIKRSLIKNILKMESNYFLYKKLFKSKHVKTLIIEDGYYGLDKAVIIKAAKNCDIKVIEPQHGFINQNHPAYNYGEKVIVNRAYKTYVPDILLCYGDFWANNINIPNQKYILGNPHLEESLKKYSNIKPLKKILVLGSGVTIEETNALLKELLSIKPALYQVVYRPHPQERPDTYLRYGTQIDNGVSIDEDDLYLSMSESEIIIGELTTAIFEAVALQKKVFLYNSSYTKTYFNDQIKYFNVFSLTNIRIIFDDQVQDSKANDYYWVNDWQKSYEKLHQII